MKRWLSLILAAALLLTAVPALAVQGDAIIARNGQDGFDDYAMMLCVIGDEVWIEGQRGAYVYNAASGEMAAYSWDDATLAAMKGENRDENGAQKFTYTTAWFAYQDAAYALLLSYSYGGEGETGNYQAALARVRIQDGRASFEESGAVDWKGLSDELDEGVYLSNTAVVNDTLCCVAQSRGNEVVIFLPLNGSAPRVVYLGDVWPSGMTIWNGDILIVQNMDTAQYAVLPFDGDALGAWQNLPDAEGAQGGNVSGVVQYGDELIYLSGNTLMAFNPETGAAREVANIPVDSGYTSAFVTESGVYVTGTFSGVALRALNREGESGEMLTVNDSDNGGEAQNAIVRFMNEQGAEVATVQQDDILTALLTKSTAFDVALLSTHYNGGDLRAILSRGWARPIESEALAEYVSGMYPAVSSALMKDGKALGVPFSVDVTVPGVSVGALKALGLTIDDVPTSWPELIDWLNNLIPTATVPLVDDYDSAEGLREMFVRAILETYWLELDAGTVDGYDTDELRAALAAVERLDAEGLSGLTTGYVDEADLISGLMEEEDVAVNPLFTAYALAGVNGMTYQDDYTEIPLYVSISSDLPKRAPLEGYVAVINPYSEHIELATRFLETLAETDGLPSRATLRPDLNETVRSADYERYTSEYDKKIARLEEELKTAEGNAKDVIEQDLADARQTRADMENWYWIVSAQSLERYRDSDAGVVLDLETGDYSFYKVIDQYCGGQINMDDFIAALQKKLEMRRMEEQ